MNVTVNCTRPKYVCGNEYLKLYGTTDGYFPDFGHHLEGEMGGLWLYPVKLLDGFWMRIKDHENPMVDGYIGADSFSSYPYKNEFVYGNGMGHTPFRIRRSQLAPDGVKGMIISYTFANAGSTPRGLTAELVFRTDLRPCWLSEEAGITDGSEDVISYSSKEQAFLAKDCEHDWYVMVGSDCAPTSVRQGQFFGPEITKGNGVSGALSYEIELQGGEEKTITFMIAGSLQTSDDCRKQYQLLCKPIDYETEKKSRLEALCDRTKLQSGNEQLDEIFDWIKVHTDWLTMDCPAVGRGITAGLPEYPWWFGCDSCYAIFGMLAMGDFDLCRSTLKLILDWSMRLNGNGRIIHEILPNEVSPNLGNTQETALYIIAVWEYYCWSGDVSLLQEAYPYLQKSVAWLKDMDEDGDYFPSGYGIIEIAGLNMEMIDTAVYSCVAWERFSKICQVLDKEGAEEWLNLANKAREAINTKLWDEKEGLYCDCYASYDRVVSRKKEILEQVPTDIGDGDKMKDRLNALIDERAGLGNEECGWLLNRNWVINTPMEMGIAKRELAECALQNMHNDQFIGQWGMYLDGLQKKHIMTISTGVMAVAQAVYGYSDRALDLINRMLSTFGAAMPGSISEMSPDYGCMVQAWTAYGVMVPIVRYFFGIQPYAAERKIVICPCLPTSWKKVSLQHVKVFDGELSLTFWMEQGEMRGLLNYRGNAEICVDEKWKNRLTVKLEKEN